MTTKQPSIGDRVVFHNPICEADRFGTVIAKRETRFGVDYQAQLDETPDELKYFSHYVGTAHDRGGYAHTLNHGGIGAYLIVPSAPESVGPDCTDNPGWALCDKIEE